jgi:DNA-binding XRE family transcriptional regulator
MNPDTATPYRPWVELEAIRTKDGYSRAALAKVAGISEEAIRLYEVGQRQPKETTVRKLADVLRVPYSVLEPGNPSAHDKNAYATLIDQARDAA